ncbi:SDR family oxidoreductase [Actinokineospora sp. NBRC 105648]|uniref:SDR family oxidoreductase n=1 Tax=Actinokineospora sp. NBRC 105648 TaxID=3032206 RepID=UPI002556F877|nr:SDR family oxidoreductase [Actinokineospora sp. NBRC 105648]
MADQTTRRDPRSQYPGPASAETIEHPGPTDQMDREPDHGEHTYRGSGRLTDTAAVITGGDSGIGRAVAIAFAREGADVLITCLPEEKDDAATTAALITDAGRRAEVVVCDLILEADNTRVVDQAVAAFGRIDVLVCNAAYQMSRDAGLPDIDTEQFDRVLKTNVYALFWLCKAALPHLPPGASIITTSSIQAFQPSPNLLDYATSKAAIVNLTKGLALNLIDRGIRVNSVAPGPVWTPLIPATMPPDKVDSFGAQAPLGRPAQPAELAPTYVFLASQESSYTTGETIAVTGGTPIT